MNLVDLKRDFSFAFLLEEALMSKYSSGSLSHQLLLVCKRCSSIMINSENKYLLLSKLVSLFPHATGYDLLRDFHYSAKHLLAWGEDFESAISGKHSCIESSSTTTRIPFFKGGPILFFK